jgi:dephospho-CoA kinase
VLWIGLTGGIASGKSSVSNLLRARAYAVVDADQLAREVVQIGTPGHADVLQAFGPDVFLKSGELHRKKVGELVFKDRTQLTRLEGILHPRIRELATKRRRELEALGQKLAFYDVPLLFEKSMESLFDVVVVVRADPAVQLERMMKRDGFTRDEAERRLQAQMPIGEKAKRTPFVISNDGSPQDLAREVDECLQKLKRHQAQT